MTNRSTERCGRATAAVRCKQGFCTAYSTYQPRMMTSETAPVSPDTTRCDAYPSIRMLEKPYLASHWPHAQNPHHRIFSIHMAIDSTWAAYVNHVVTSADTAA